MGTGAVVSLLMGESAAERHGGTIDVVIPVRNRPATLRQAVRSIQVQTVAVDRIIIVDDASTDHSCDVIVELSKGDARIEMIGLRKRVGAAAARNRGVEVAKSDWIAFLDSDDEWLPEKLERQLEAIAAVPHAIACFTGHLGVADEKTVYEYPLPKQFARSELLGRNVLGTTSSAIVRRDMLLSIGGFDDTLSSCQDWDLWVRLNAVGKFAIVEHPLVLFRLASENRITKDLNAVLAGHQRIFTKNLAGLNRPLDQLRVRSLHKMRMAEIMAWDFGRPHIAVRQAVFAALLWPSRRNLRFTAGLIGQSLSLR